MPITHFTEKFFKLKAEFIKDHIINESKQEYILDVQLPVKAHKCPCCNEKTTQIKNYRLRKVELGIQYNYTIIARYNHRRYICKSCGKSFSESNPFVKRYQQLRTLFKHYLIESLGEILSYTAIAKRFNVSITTVIRYLEKMKLAKPSKLPVVLSIDKFKGNAAGQKYQVILTDRQSGTIIDILPKRDTKAIEEYLRSFNRKKRRAVRFVVMDMSVQFRSIMEKIFTWAHIVADRFHVVRLVNWALENVRKPEQKTLTNYSKTLKQNKKVLLKHYTKLTDEEKNKLTEILNAFYDIWMAYNLKLRFGWLKRTYGKDKIDNYISHWLERVRASKLDEFSHLLKTFNTWRTPVVNAFLLPFSNGFTEGCNNKIKVLKRISYGLRNFERFRVRILILGAKNGTSCKKATDAKKCA